MFHGMELFVGVHKNCAGDCCKMSYKISLKAIDILYLKWYNKLKQMNKYSYVNDMEVYIMKKTYAIEVDCANCANKMETAAKNTEGVKDAAVNFMALKMKVEFEEGADEKAVMKNVLKACRKVEPDCEIEF